MVAQAAPALRAHERSRSTVDAAIWSASSDPNGSGKTTLLKMLAGTLLPQSGSVSLERPIIARVVQREIARRVAVVPQETHAPFDFTVLEIVLMGRFPHLGAFALEGPEDLAIARRALAATGNGGIRVNGSSAL